MLTEDEWREIKRLRTAALGISAIARRLGRSRTTVRKWLGSSEPPRYAPRPPRTSILAPYKDHLRARIGDVPEPTTVRLLGEIRGMGYTGGYTTVKRFLRGERGPRTRRRRT